MVDWGDELSSALATAVSLWKQDQHTLSLSMPTSMGFQTISRRSAWIWATVSVSEPTWSYMN